MMVQPAEDLRGSGAPDYAAKLVNVFNARNKVSGMDHAHYPVV